MRGEEEGGGGSGEGEGGGERRRIVMQNISRTPLALLREGLEQLKSYELLQLEVTLAYTVLQHS